MSNIWDNLGEKTYQINLGDSLKSKNVSYHSINYNIKPRSIDHTKQGVLHCNQDDEMFLIEYASHQSEEIFQFSGNQKEINKELILFYDKATNTFTLEKLDSAFHVRRDAFNKSRSKLQNLNNGENEVSNIPKNSSTKSAKRNTKPKGRPKKSPPVKNEPVPETFEEESVEEFDLASENSNPEDQDNKNPLAAYERMRAESTKAKANAKAKAKAPSPPQNELTNEDDNMIKEFEQDLEELDVAEEAEKEIEEFALEDELEQELEKELEVSGEEEDAKLSDNDLDEEMLEEINDTLELDSSEEESEDNMSPSSKRKMDQDQGSAKRSKPAVHDGPISLSAFAGNDEEEEESTESSSSDDD